MLCLSRVRNKATESYDHEHNLRMRLREFSKSRNLAVRTKSKYDPRLYARASLFV